MWVKLNTAMSTAIYPLINSAPLRLQNEYS